jgi:TP901 family phage tail tape measure protein
MADETKIDILVEANDVQAVGSINRLAHEVTSLLGNMQAMQRALDNMMSGTAKQAEKLAGVLKATNAAVTSQNARGVRNSAQLIAAGDANTQFRNAGRQRVVNDLRADPAYSALQIEKEQNKVAEARLELYRRMRAMMPSNASEKDLTSAWRDVNNALMGKDHPRQTGAATLASVKDETLAFEKKLTAERVALKETEVRQVQEIYNRAARTRVAQLEKLGAEEREIEQKNMVSRLASYAKGKGLNVDESQLHTTVNDELARRAALNVRAPVVSQKTREQRVEDRVQASQDFMGYQGGAAAFGIQAQFMAQGAAMSAITGSFHFAASSAIEFQTSLKDLQAITESTDGQMKSLTKTIIDVGSNSKFSLADIAEGAKVLAQAGYSATQIDAALKPIINYASATGSSVKDAVETTTSVLNQFDMSIERTGMVTDVMTAGLNKSKLNAQQLSLGIQYAGNQAALSNVSFEELTAALGAMANAGIRSGSTIGTGLRMMLAELDQPSTKFKAKLVSMGLSMDDISLKTHSLSEVMHNLAGAGFTYSDALGSFDKRTAAAFAALSNNLPVMEELQHGISGTEAATKAAGTQMDTWSAQWTRLKNSITGVAYTAGSPLLQFLQAITGVVAGGIAALGPFAAILTVVGTALTAVTAVAITSWLANLAKGLLTSSAALNAFGLSELAAATAADGAAVSVGAFSTALLFSPLGIFALGLGAAVGAFAAFNYIQDEGKRKLDDFAAKASDAGAEADKYGSRVGELDKSIERLIDRHASLIDNQRLAGQAAETAMGQFHGWGLEIEGSTKDVDNLINSLIVLRGKMEAIRLEKIKLKGDALGGEIAELQKQTSGGQGTILGVGSIQSNAQGTLMRSGNEIKALDPKLYDMIKVAANSKNLADIGQLDKIKDRLAAIADKLPSQFRDDPANLGRSVGAQLEKLVQLGGLQGDQRDVRNAEAREYVHGSAVNDLAKEAAANLTFTNDRKSYIATIQDPVERKKAQVSLDESASLRAAALKQHMAEAVQRIKASQYGASLAAQAMDGGNGSDVDGFIGREIQTSNPIFAKALTAGREYGAVQNVAVLKAQYAETKAHIAALKKKKDFAGAAELAKKLDPMDHQIAILSHPELSPEDALAIGDANAGADAYKQTRGAGRGGGSADRNAGVTAGRDAKAMELKIKNYEATLGPTAEDMLAGGPALEAMIKTWKGFKEKQVREQAIASKASPEDLKHRLEDLAEEEKKFRNEIINGNIAAAKELLAKTAELAASDALTAAVGDIKLNDGALKENVDEVMKAYNAAMLAAIEASNAAFIAAHPDATPEQNAAQVDKIKQLQRDWMGKQIKADLTLVQSYYDGLSTNNKQALASVQGKLAVRSADNARYSNAWGSENLSDVQRAMAARRDQKIAMDGSQSTAFAATMDYKNAKSHEAELQSRYDKADEIGKGFIQGDLDKARDATIAMKDAAQKAYQAYRGMNEQAKPFSSAIEAISASWDVFIQKSGAAKPMFEQLADGMTGVFSTAQSSMTTFFSDILSGTKNVGTAFKDMARAILSSMLDLAAKMIANKLIMWVIQMFASKGVGVPGSAGGSDAPSIPSGFAYHGGAVRARGFAHGGSNPDRDSVLAMLQPGEFVMSKSAVSMVGEKNLRSMNAMGNRRMNAMPTVAGSMPQRQPDNANVWIVAPGTKPTLGRSDVLAIMTEDMMQGGNTRQLVKSIAMGG